jgi:hypothetical protein
MSTNLFKKKLLPISFARPKEIGERKWRRSVGAGPILYGNYSSEARMRPPAAAP